MASFPNSVFTRADVTNGQTSQPSDVNDLSAEITAIEDGLLNGTAPLNSSHITAGAGLQVTGNSTFGSTITIGNFRYIFPSTAGNAGDHLQVASTSGSTITLEWRPQAAAAGSTMLLVRATNGSTQTINGQVGLNWTTVSASRGTAMISTSANSSRLTFKDSTGFYQVGAQVTWSTLSSGTTIILKMWLNDATVIAETNEHSTRVQIEQVGQQIMALVPVASTADYITITARQLNGTAGAILAHASTSPTVIWASFVST